MFISFRINHVIVAFPVVQYLPFLILVLIISMDSQMADFKKKILIVDDEEDLTWSITRRLTRNGDTWEIICAESGNKALEILAQNRFDLMVTDLRMPGVSGLQLLSEVKLRYPHTPVIVMTAFGTLEVKEVLERWGGIGYIEKPFEFEELRHLIHTHLETTECV
jgi:DNA-binding NtrC family response regulator